MATISEKNIDLASLDRIRTKFIGFYEQNDNAKKYPNVLFDYEKKVEDAGHLEAYNYWLLRKGDEDAFTEWHVANKQKFDDFAKWFSDNPIQLDADHEFYREQY